jgi:prophage regulatory protein
MGTTNLSVPVAVASIAGSANAPPSLLVRLPAVLKVTGLGRSTIYRWIAEGSFPAPVRLGRRAVVWRWSDLDRWTQSRATTHH